MVIVVVAVSLIVGACFGFLICGVLSVGHEDESLTEAKKTIQKQTDTINWQSELIAEMRTHLAEMEDDGK